jgi:hypothetical protein
MHSVCNLVVQVQQRLMTVSVMQDPQSLNHLGRQRSPRRPTGRPLHRGSLRAFPLHPLVFGLLSTGHLIATAALSVNTLSKSRDRLTPLTCSSTPSRSPWGIPANSLLPVRSRHTSATRSCHPSPPPSIAPVKRSMKPSINPARPAPADSWPPLPREGFAPLK